MEIASKLSNLASEKYHHLLNFSKMMKKLNFNTINLLNFGDIFQRILIYNICKMYSILLNRQNIFGIGVLTHSTSE